MLQYRPTLLLRDLVELDDLGLVVRACERGLSRRIDWVHTTELIDPSRYLEGGELILTTGLWRRRRGDEERYVTALVSSGVCGLVYGLPKPKARMPLELVAACERHDLPLLEASWDLPFIAISKAVVGWFADERHAVLLSAIRRNEEFVAVIAGGGGSTGILAVLARDLPGSIWLLGSGGRVTTVDAPSLSPEEVRKAWISIAQADQSPIELALPGNERGTAFTVIEVGYCDLYLVVRRRLRDITTEERTAIDQALAFLGLESARNHAVRAIEARFARELLDLVAAGESRLAEIAARLRAYGLDPDGSLVALVALLPDADSTERDRAAEAIEAFFAARNMPAVVPAAGNEALAIFGHPPPEVEIQQLARELADTLRQMLAPHLVAVGLGAPVRGAGELRRSVVEARHGSRLALRRRESPWLITYDQVGSHSLLLALQDEQLMEKFHSALLGPVVAYDVRRGTELVHTLDVFLETGGRWQEAAARLNIHVNTLRYRVGRIEALTGRRLDSTESRVDFYLALRARDKSQEGEVVPRTGEPEQVPTEFGRASRPRRQADADAPRKERLAEAFDLASVRR